MTLNGSPCEFFGWNKATSEFQLPFKGLTVKGRPDLILRITAHIIYRSSHGENVDGWGGGGDAAARRHDETAGEFLPSGDDVAALFIDRFGRFHLKQGGIQ